MSKDGWRRVSKAAPCPICQKDHACKVTTDGEVAMCKRISEGAFKSSKGWHFHRLRGASARGHGEQELVPVRENHQRPTRSTKAYSDVEAAIRAAARLCRGVFVNQWIYTDKHGNEVFRVVRFALTNGGKAYRPFHLATDGWRIGTPPGPLPLYRLPDIPDEGAICIAEGEKAVDAARSIGLQATTSAHGAGAADKTDWTPLAGREVHILPDSDEAGTKYAQQVAIILCQLRPPAKVKVVKLAGLPPKGDIVDYIHLFDNRTNDEIKSDIEDAANQTPFQAVTTLVGGPKLIRMSDVQPRSIEWLWPERIPQGRISLLVGKPGGGKSFLTMFMAAQVTQGGHWPDNTPCPKGSVILITAEDGLAETIRPRLDAHGADCTRIKVLREVTKPDRHGTMRERLFVLTDLAELEESLQQMPDCKLVVIDPIGSFLGNKLDAHRDSEVRSALSPVAALAEKYRVAVLIVAHRRKGSDNNADETALGSVAFTGIARSVWHLSRDQLNKERRLLVPGKSNVSREGTGLAFMITGEPASIVWEPDPVEMSADDALAAENGIGERARPGPKGVQTRLAIEWLKGVLGNGQRHAVKELQALACEKGLAWRTVHKASQELKVAHHRSGFQGEGSWQLPASKINGAERGEGNISAQQA